MTKKIALVLLLFFLSNLFSETIIENNSDIGNQTWTKADSPYIINGRAFIPQAKTLNIESGVQVKFQTGDVFDASNGINAGYLEVKGKISAEGAEDDLIIFTGNSGSDFWSGVFFLNTMENNLLTFCKIERAYGISNLEDQALDGAISVYSSKLQLNNCLISENQQNGIYFDENSEYTITDCAFSQNELNGVYTVYSNGTIEKSLFYQNKENGIFIYNSDPTVVNCKCLNNTLSGINCTWYSSPAIINNLTANNGYNGIHCYYESDAIITNNTTAYNGSAGIHIERSKPDIKNTIVYGNRFDVNFGGSYNDPVISHCLFEDSYLSSLFTNEGGMILEGSAQFKNPPESYGVDYDALNYNYDIQYGSDARDAGTPSTSGLNLPEKDLIGNDRIFGEIIDMGAYEFSNNFPIINSQLPTESSFSVTNSEPVEFSITASDLETENLTYSWFVNDVNQNHNSPTFSYNFNAKQNYTVLAIASDGELADSTSWSIEAASVINILKPENSGIINCYPNPFNPVTTLSYNLKNTDNISLDLYNNQGQIVKELFKGKKDQGFHQQKVDCQNFSSGIYYIKLKTENQTFTQKINLIK